MGNIGFAIDHFLSSANQLVRLAEPFARFAIDHFLSSANPREDLSEIVIGFAIDHFLSSANQRRFFQSRTRALP